MLNDTVIQGSGITFWCIIPSRNIFVAGESPVHRYVGSRQIRYRVDFEASILLALSNVLDIQGSVRSSFLNLASYVFRIHSTVKKG